MNRLFLLLVLFPGTALAAAPGTYTLLAPLGGMTTVTLTEYAEGAIQVLIGLAGLIAVVRIVICGIQMIGTPSVSARSEAKECITSAIFGLLLAVTSWIILNTINTQLIQSDFNLLDVQNPPPSAAPGPTTDPLPTKPGWYFKYSDTTGTHFNFAGNSAAACAELIPAAVNQGKTIIRVDGRDCFEVLARPAPTYTGPLLNEADTRIALCGNASCVGSKPLGVNVGPCPGVGSRGCTNVAGLGNEAIAAIKLLPGACACNVVISGGTEYWLHSNTPGSSSNHAPGNSVFDLAKSDQLDALIKNPSNPRKPSFTGHTRWFYGGFWYTDEPETRHWHVCGEYGSGTALPYCKN